MEFKAEAKLVEAIMFLESEPLDINTLSRITKLSRDIVLKSLLILKEEYNRDHHGLEVIEIGGGFSFSPKKELWPSLKDRYGKQNENKLSRAALETLSIIAYSQPITRGEIEGIRGVAADGMIKLLLSKSLIRELGKKDVPGRPIQYGTTKEFLKLFRLKSISDLPKLDEVDSEKFETDE
ncbi:MAG: SMC-Scp complex subunit ScpB [Spirochaetales bacterium]|nr:SMC-Scp complex subunit ScpB [Spirochaetales bacterium]